MQCHVLEKAVSIGGKGDLSVWTNPRHGAMLRQVRQLIEQAVDRAVDAAEEVVNRRRDRRGPRRPRKHEEGEEEAGTGGGGLGGEGEPDDGQEEDEKRVAIARHRQALDLLEELLVAEVTNNR